MADQIPPDLQTTVALLDRVAPPIDPPLSAGLGPRVFAAIAAEADHSTTTAADAQGWRRKLALVGAVAAVAVGGLVLSTALRDGDGAGPPVELRAQLVVSGNPGRSASAEVVKTGIGRVVSFDTTALPILPKGDYYELWFVGPGDRPGAPDRISAGTFHPDEQGRSQVTFAAAVDPAKYPVLAVTAEPGDGSPAPTLPDVMRSQAN